MPADGILDVFKAAGLDRSRTCLTLCRTQFLAEVAQTKQKHLAIETLRRLLAGEIKARERTNVVEAKKLTDRLARTPCAATTTAPSTACR